MTENKITFPDCSGKYHGKISNNAIVGKRLLTSVLHKEAVSHMLDNQWYIWWDKAGKFLGPRRVRNGPIALHKMSTVK